MANFLPPILFLFIFASIEDCFGNATKLPIMAKRKAKKVVMIVVLNVEYDHPEIFYWSFDEKHIKWFVRTREDLDLFNKKVKEFYQNENGKFAIVYTVRGSCEQMIKYAKRRLVNVDFIITIRIKCGEKQLVLKS